jgi:hypothetical protein
MVIYPFKTTMAGSPLITSDGNENIITFNFREIALFKQQAEYYVQEHSIGMYPVLPTMQGVDHILMRTAMDELFEACQGMEGVFAEQFVWMELLLERTRTISLPEKERIRRNLQVYDSLWENHPRVKQLRAEIAAGKAQGRAEGRAEGELQGKLEASRQMFVNIVKVRFPDLTELAQQEANKITHPDQLDLLAQKIVVAPDEDTARWLLSSPVA